MDWLKRMLWRPNDEDDSAKEISETELTALGYGSNVYTSLDQQRKETAYINSLLASASVQSAVDFATPDDGYSCFLVWKDGQLRGTVGLPGLQSIYPKQVFELHFGVTLTAMTSQADLMELGIQVLLKHRVLEEWPEECLHSLWFGELGEELAAHHERMEGRKSAYNIQFLFEL